jgi:Cu2+-exporting ATPase
MRQVEDSAKRRAPIVETANRLAAWFVAIVLVLATATFVWWQFADPSQAMDNAIALLVVTCPCALALSTPLAVSMAIGGAARAGIFIKGGDALERLARPGKVFLDKTGTITEGRTGLVAWEGPDWVRPYVLAVEADSSHPIAAGFRRAWTDVSALRATDTDHIAGGGIVGRVDGRRVVVGSPRFVLRFADRDFVTDELLSRIDPTLTPVLVAIDDNVIAAAALGDPIRADSADAIARLRSRRWDVSILSGDARSVAIATGEKLGIASDHCIGDASPEEKLRVIEHALGDAPVVMVGDGINDAAAIAAASVGIGVHGGAQACLASADIYLTTPGLGPLVRLVRGAERTMRVIRRNITFSIVYNLLGAGLAMSGRLTPLVAAILMPVSSLTVVFASWRGRGFHGGAE